STSTSSVSASASHPATAMQSNGSVGERTRLLSEERTSVTSSPPPPPPPSLQPPSSPPPPVPTSLPLVHTTLTVGAELSTNQQNEDNNNAQKTDKHQEQQQQQQQQQQHQQQQNQNNNNATGEPSTTTTTTADEEDVSSDVSDKFPRPQKKPGKLSKLGTKQVGLKRVSFGSSKGSMVETLVFETPTPLAEHVEPMFGFDAAATVGSGRDASAAAGQLQSQSTHPHPHLHQHPTHLPLSGNGYSGDYGKGTMDDSGIEVQEESERSIVRVTFYQSSEPQQIYPPAEYLESLEGLRPDYKYQLQYESAVAAMSHQHEFGMGPGFERQPSTDSGWDNPFRPGGDLSREADEIVNMIRGGKPITPTEDRTIGNGSAHAEDNYNGGAAIGESVTKTNISQNLATAQNGTNSHAGGRSAAEQSNNGAAGNNGVTNLGQVSKQVVPGPASASHVVIDEKKAKKRGCCVIQ
ncbi:hypothetical protein KR018_002752, partial [Drosophila ironensis]